MLRVGLMGKMSPRTIRRQVSPSHPPGVRFRGEVDAVDRARRGAHHEIGRDTRLDQHLEHPHMHGTEAPASGQGESGGAVG